MNKPQAILFDLDGVVNNSIYFSYIYAKEHNVPLENIQKIFNDGRKDLTNIGKADLKEVMQEVLAEWQWHGTVDQLLDLWFKTNLKLDMRVIDTIQNLRRDKIKCYLATDQEKYRTAYLRNEIQIDKYFDGTFISCEIGYVKYQKEFFKVVLNKLALQAQNIVYIDDSQNKLDIAKQTAIQIYLYTSFEEFETFIKLVTD